MKNKQQEPWERITNIIVWTIVGIVLVGTAAVITILDDGSYSSGKSLDQLQQERFEYEAGRDRVRQQMQTREQLNKIRSGYYD